MSDSEMREAGTTRPHGQPVTRDQLLDHAEAPAIRPMATPVRRLGEEGADAAIRHHPVTATVIGAWSGFAGGRLIQRRWKAMLRSLRDISNPKPREPRRLVFVSVRAVRAPRRRE